jgi:uncharacterized membrane protein YccC
VIDEVIGEAPILRLGSRGLRAAVEGLFAGLSSWRLVANHLELLPGDGQRHQEADAVLQTLPAVLRSTVVEKDPSGWKHNAVQLRRVCTAAVRSILALRTHTPSLRMLADGAAQALIGIARSLNGIALLNGCDRNVRRFRAVQLPIPDYHPALINAVRTFLMICAIEFS